MPIVSSAWANGLFSLRDDEGAMDLHQDAKRIALARGDRVSVAKACGDVAACCGILGQFEKAITWLEEVRR